MRSVLETLDIIRYNSLATCKFLASCLDDLTFNPTVCPVLHNFPLDSSLSFPCLTSSVKSFHTCACVSSSRSSV